MGSGGQALGVLNQRTVLDEVLLEMLDHQGILYEEVGNEAARTYPVVLLTTPESDALATARRSCSSADAVIVVGKSIDLRKVLRCLSGLEDTRADRLGCTVNQSEVELVELIKEACASAKVPLVRKGFWPGNAPACCVITGDVDWLTYSPFHAAVAKGGLSPGRAAGLVYGSLKRRNFGLNFDAMVEPMKRHGHRSTVFLRAAYEKGEENLADAVSLLKDAGFEIGLHGSEGAHTNLDSLSSQLEAIRSLTGATPRGTRHHILKVKVPTTWEIESSAGLDYDATFSYNRFFGFRGEVCFPYHPFGSRRLPLLELPTSFMDWTALNRGMRGESAERILNSITERVEHYHGLLMVNFHNTYLNRETFPDVLGLYERLIDRVTERRYWVTTAESCSEWWRRRAAARPEFSLDGRNPTGGDEIPLEVLTHGHPSSLEAKD
jgi:hypothetical protein